jgi:hypothetical protein
MKLSLIARPIAARTECCQHTFRFRELRLLFAIFEGKAELALKLAGEP